LAKVVALTDFLRLTPISLNEEKGGEEEEKKTKHLCLALEMAGFERACLDNQA
jgi:hypothetical protein